MALNTDNLDDGEFWLPSEFLTDDDFLLEKKHECGGKNMKPDSGSIFCFPDEFPFGNGFNGSLNSPGESVETESDEEEFLSGLTQQMTRSMMIEDASKSTTKSWGLSGSPQSTLGAWGTVNGKVSAPPTPPLTEENNTTNNNDKEAAWDLLYAAAGQVVRLKNSHVSGKGDVETYRNQRSKGLLGLPQNPNPAPLKPHHQQQQQQMSNGTSGFYPNHGLVEFRLQQIKQFNQMKEMQQYYNSRVQGVRANDFQGRRINRQPLNMPESAWPSLPHPHQHHQSQPGGMRAVFLGDRNRVSSGTGVFLPRRAGCISETRKKPGCSTVLLPARVVQALNLDIDSFGAAQPRFNTTSYGQAVIPPAKRSHPWSQSQPMVYPQEVSLPQEWTY